MALFWQQELPSASSKEKGEQDKGRRNSKKIFSLTAMEARSKCKTGQMQNLANGGGYISDGSIEKCIPQLITPDFILMKMEVKCCIESW